MSFPELSNLKKVLKEFITEYRDTQSTVNEEKITTCNHFETQIDAITTPTDLFKLVEELFIVSTQEQIAHRPKFLPILKMYKPDSHLGSTLNAMRSYVLAEVKNTSEFQEYFAAKNESYYLDLAKLDEQLAQFQQKKVAADVTPSFKKTQEEFYLSRAALGDAGFISRASNRGYLSCWDNPGKDEIMSFYKPAIEAAKTKQQQRSVVSSPATPVRTERQQSSASLSPTTSESPPTTPVKSYAFTETTAMSLTLSPPSSDQKHVNTSVSELADTKYTPARFSVHVPYALMPEFHLWFYERHIQHNAVAKRLGENKKTAQQLVNLNNFAENVLSGTRQKARAEILAEKLAALAAEAKKPSSWNRFLSAISPEKKAVINDESKRASSPPLAAPAGSATPVRNRTPSPARSLFSAQSSVDTDDENFSQRPSNAVTGF